MYCSNPECRRYFVPERSDQKHCNKRCRRRAYQIKRTRNGENTTNHLCQTKNCMNKVRLTKRQARYSRKHYGKVLCDECKASTAIKQVTATAAVTEGIITDPYEEGLFIPDTTPDYGLVCPLG